MSHPGHELRILGFVERLRPRVAIVTDGSGRNAAPRIATSAGVLAAVGAKPSGLLGRLRDRQVYAAVRRGDHALFTAIAEEIADDLVENGISLLVSDAPEHAILTHDLVAAIADTAVALAARRGRAIDHYDFLLHGPPQACPEGRRAGALRLELDDAALARKERFAARYREIAPEIERDRTTYGDTAFRVELLRPVVEPFDRIRPQAPPEWQRHGERLAREGVYPEALTYARHVAPLVDALRRRACG